MGVNVGIRMTNIGEYLRVFVIDVLKEEMGEQEMANTLKDMKYITGAKTIDIGDITVAGMPFKLIFSATVNDSMHISAVDGDGKPVFRGNIIAVGTEKLKGGTEVLRSLTDDEVFLLMANTGLMAIDSAENGGLYNAYVLCNVVSEG